MPIHDLPKLSPRNSQSHKGDFGRALLIGGSCGMDGAIALSGMAALRSGSGLVTLAVPQSSQATVAQFEPSYMTVALAETDDGHLGDEHLLLEKILADKTAVACGPGLGRNPQTAKLVHWLYQSVKAPLVVDADGLNAFAENPLSISQAVGPRILTPHPGEFERLFSEQPKTDEQRIEMTERIAQRENVVLVLKGHRTVISDGTKTTINATGNPGMATGGSGDVLTGIITALLCQKMTCFDAARLAVYVHGRAGDLAAQALGQTSMIASDLIEYLPDAFAELE